MNLVRTIPDGGYLVAGANTVIQHEGVTHVFIPGSAFRDSYFMVMNMTKSSIAIQVERDEFPIDYSGNDCTSAVIPPWSQAYIAITYDPARSSRVAQIAGFISDTNGGQPQPADGDYLPKVDPVFEGSLKNENGSFLSNSSNFKASVSVATLNAGMSLAINSGSSRLSMSPSAITFSKTIEVGGPGKLEDKSQFALLTRAQTEELIEIKNSGLVSKKDPAFEGSMSGDSLALSGSLTVGNPDNSQEENDEVNINGLTTFQVCPQVHSVLNVAEVNDMSLITVGQAKQLVSLAVSKALGKVVKI